MGGEEESEAQMKRQDKQHTGREGIQRERNQIRGWRYITLEFRCVLLWWSSFIQQGAGEAGRSSAVSCLTSWHTHTFTNSVFLLR